MSQMTELPHGAKAHDSCSGPIGSPLSDGPGRATRRGTARRMSRPAVVTPAIHPLRAAARAVAGASATRTTASASAAPWMSIGRSRGCCGRQPS
jgi:hypothetical protein